ncbi:MAG: hypothetical protein ACTSVI_14500 [Promethearchaeota archaeon]
MVCFKPRFHGRDHHDLTFSSLSSRLIEGFHLRFLELFQLFHFLTSRNWIVILDFLTRSLHVLSRDSLVARILVNDQGIGLVFEIIPA